MRNLATFFSEKKIIVIVLAAVLAAGGIFADEPDIKNLKIDRSNGKIYGSYKIANAFGSEIKKRIESGLQVTFKHHFRVVNPNFFWRNEKISIKELKTTVQYDSLTKQYNLRKTLNGGVTDSATTQNYREVKKWMSEIENLALCSVRELEKGLEYSFRVKTKLLDRTFFFFIPNDLDADWEKTNFIAGRNNTAK